MAEEPLPVSAVEVTQPTAQPQAGQQIGATTYLQNIQKEREEMTKLRDEIRKEKEEIRELRAEQILSGQSGGAQQAQPPKQETDREYRQRIDREMAAGKRDWSDEIPADAGRR